MADDRKYTNIQKQFRKKFLGIQQQLEKNYGDINNRLKKRIMRIAYDYSDSAGNLTTASMNAMQQEIDGLSYWFADEMKDFLDDNIVRSADIAISGQDEAAKYYIKELMRETSGTSRKALRKALTDGKDGILLRVKYGEGLLDNIRDFVWDYRWTDGYKLSDRIWKLQGTMNQQLKSIVEQSVNQGKSAVNFSRAVEDYLEKPGPAWRTDIKPGLQAGDTIQVREGVSYTLKQPRATVKGNALRLARTETNQAYHKAQQISDKESDVVKGTKWNLSGSHPNYGYYEICEKRADHDEGLGKGVYPPGGTPWDHPNGFCYLVSVLKEKDELISTLKNKYNR